MPSIVKPISSRSYIITSADNGLILDLGPAASSASVGTFVLQFNPDTDSDFSAIVMARCWGPAAKDLDVPFVPVSYRLASLNNQAQLYPLVTAAITQPALIQVPANWAIGLFITATLGKCPVVSWDLQGNSAP